MVKQTFFWTFNFTLPRNTFILVNKLACLEHVANIYMHRELPCWKGISIEKRESWIKSHQINNMSPCQWHLIGDPLSLLLQGALACSMCQEKISHCFEVIWWNLKCLCMRTSVANDKDIANHDDKILWQKAEIRLQNIGLNATLAKASLCPWLTYSAWCLLGTGLLYIRPPAVHKKKHLTQPNRRLIIGLWYLHQWSSYKIQRQWTMPRNFQPCQKLVHGLVSAGTKIYQLNKHTLYSFLNFQDSSGMFTSVSYNWKGMCWRQLLWKHSKVCWTRSNIYEECDMKCCLIELHMDYNINTQLLHAVEYWFRF